LEMFTYYFGLYLGVGVLLGIWNIYLGERLLRYVDRQYPEEGKVIRSYGWQMYPWSVGQRTLRALIKREGANDTELARRAKKAKRALIYVISWTIGFFFLDSFIISKYY
jgi:hypothetical protein